MNRPEYPRPDFVRAEWLCLNGGWDFRFEGEDWRGIEVPFVFQCAKSGIGDNRMCDRVAYRRAFTVPEAWKGRRVLLHFGAVDYRADVYINGSLAGSHEGSSAPFSFDITDMLRGEEETVTVDVWDPCGDETIPRGKQYWKPEPESIWYTRSTGIWQSVWLEPVSPVRLARVRFTPDIDAGNVTVEYETAGGAEGCTLHCAFTFQDSPAFAGEITLAEPCGSFTANLFGHKIFRTINHDCGWCWSPEHPNLFAAHFSLRRGGSELDAVQSYFGMRKIEAVNGMVYLNNRPYYQRLVLDQGYWPETLMTAPDDDAYRKDIEMAKQMGFNGCRKHQKAEDPRFLYWADRLGYLVWSEVPSCPSFSAAASQRLMREWAEIVERDYSHPCIVAWVVLNESWGVPNIRFDKKQQAHSLALYYNVRSLDGTRFIVNNDGWEITHSDLCAVHNYRHGALDEPERQAEYAGTLRTRESLVSAMPCGRQVYADGYAHGGEPIILSEFGGISYQSGSGDGWGYTTIADDGEFLAEYARLLAAVSASEALHGFCYTQLTDVEQEVNGLLTYDRKFKVQPEKIAEINRAVDKIRVK